MCGSESWTWATFRSTIRRRNLLRRSGLTSRNFPPQPGELAPAVREQLDRRLSVTVSSRNHGRQSRVGRVFPGQGRYRANDAVVARVVRPYFQMDLLDVDPEPSFQLMRCSRSFIG